jgi:hypothetical protein
VLCADPARFSWTFFLRGRAVDDLLRLINVDAGCCRYGGKPTGLLLFTHGIPRFPDVVSGRIAVKHARASIRALSRGGKTKSNRENYFRFLKTRVFDF